MRLLLASFVLAASSFPQDPLGGTFVERAAEVGLVHEFRSGQDRMGEGAIFDWVQAGIAVGDLDGDADDDVVCAGGVDRNSVFLNDGAGVFADVSAAAGIDTGEFDRVPALADYDRDGDLDLYLGAMDRPASTDPARGRLYRNDGAGVFEDVSAEAQVPGKGNTLYAVWFDVDRDGFVDLQLGEFAALRNVFYSNHGDGSFSDRSETLGLDQPGSTHVLSFADTDRDGEYDHFVGNDWPVTNAAALPGNAGDLHLQGQAAGNFVDVSAGSQYDVKRGIMGIAFGDVNYDGLPDVYKTDAGHNYLMLNQGWPGSGLPWDAAHDDYGVGDATFTDPSDPGLSGIAVGWTAIFMNLDDDPYDDLFVVNGMVPSMHPAMFAAPDDQANRMFRCDGPGSGFTFTEAAGAVGLLDHVDDRAAVAADLDGDGDQDLLVGPTAGFLRYFENQLDTAGRAAVIVELDCRTSAPNGYGTEVSWTDALGYPHLKLVGADAATASHHPNRIHFGVGDELSIDVTVLFPSGMERTYAAVPAGSTLVAVEPEMIRLSATHFAAVGSSGPAPPVGAGSPSRSAASGSGQGGVAPQPGSAEPELVVTAFAHDATGSPLGELADVSIVVPGLEPLGPVEHVQGNEYARAFRPATAPGEYRVEVAFEAFEVRVRPRVTFFGAAHPAMTGASVTPESVRAGSPDGYRLEVALRDAAGVSTGAGGDLLVRRSDEEAFQPMVDLGDGRYAADFAAPAAPGVLTHELAVADDAVVGGLFPVEAAGAVDPAGTSVYVEEPPNSETGLDMAQPHRSTLLVTPRDAGGRRLGPNADVSLVLLPGVGTEAVTWLDGKRVRQADGEFLLQFERDPASAQGSAVGNWEVWVDGTLAATGTYRF